MSNSYVCQNCHKNFEIEEEDIIYYQKINVPYPTWCPECRLIRRMIWRNEYILYRHKCDVRGHEENLISLYHEKSPMKVYDQKYWWSDEWDATEYGKEYDFTKPFFEQFKELLHTVPTTSLMGNYASLVRSDYSNWAGDLKDCYLITDADVVENSLYGSGIFKCKDVCDVDNASECELCYDCYNIHSCYKVVGSINCHECHNVYFSKGCIGCSNCFGCINLRKKSFCIHNKEYSKEEYEKKIQELFDGSRKKYEESKKKSRDFFLNYPHKNLRGTHNVNSFGDYIYHTKNTKYGFFVTDAEDCKYVSLLHSKSAKDCYDYTDWGETAEQLYECIAVGMGASKVRWSHMVYNNVKEVDYSYYCINSSNLFGCCGIRKKQYCILNKQYSKEEYETLLSAIREHMNSTPYKDSDGRTYGYGEFFPPEISPFAYNETIAQEYFPLTKEEATAKGYAWKEEDGRSYQITKKPNDVPKTVTESEDSICNEIIECAHMSFALKCNHQCTTAFRITLQELEFYRKMNLPLPQSCPRCRHYERIFERNKIQLSEQSCDCNGSASKTRLYKNESKHSHGNVPCNKLFKTTYPKNHEEIIYCEECYQSETS